MQKSLEAPEIHVYMHTGLREDNNIQFVHIVMQLTIYTVVCLV